MTPSLQGSLPSSASFHFFKQIQVTLHKLGIRMIVSKAFLEDPEGPFKAFSCALPISQRSQHAAEVVDSNGHRGMIRTVDLLADGQGPLEVFFSPLQISQVLQHVAEVVDIDCDIGMIRAINLLVYGKSCLLYTSDAADDLLCVDLGGRRIIKKKNKMTH